MLLDLSEANAMKINNGSLVVDKSKVRRERNKSRSNIGNELFKELNEIWGLFFDGKRDKTIFNSKDDSTGTYRILTKFQEHICLIKETGSNYIAHIAPAANDARTISGAIIDKLMDINSPINNLIVIGCDGTNLNTGCNAGVICSIEKHLNRPLQWLICLLHFNELPLR